MHLKIGRSGSLAALTSGLPKQPITSHPSVKGQLGERWILLEPASDDMTTHWRGLDFDYKDDSVVVSGRLVTRFVLGIAVALCMLRVNRYWSSRGPGTAFPFALTLVDSCVGG
jgi:protein DJ-1